MSKSSNVSPTALGRHGKRRVPCKRMDFHWGGIQGGAEADGSGACSTGASRAVKDSAKAAFSETSKVDSSVGASWPSGTFSPAMGAERGQRIDSFFWKRLKPAPFTANADCRTFSPNAEILTDGIFASRKGSVCALESKFNSGGKGVDRVNRTTVST